VPVGVTFAFISTGNVHACGVSPDGAAQCWGGNWAGQTDVPAGVIFATNYTSDPFASFYTYCTPPTPPSAA
jgi:hypothetical protein